MSELYLGLMSGTSMDAVDVALVDFGHKPFKLLATQHQPMPAEIKQKISTLCSLTHNEINLLGELDHQLGHLFADAAINLLNKNHIPPTSVIAIGSHGQTIRHSPDHVYPYTLQIADPNIIAEKTGITTVADFRRRDIVNGGQGAPLTPAFHAFAFQNEDYNRVVLNIGGIANITLLPKDFSRAITGFDTGPGNTLLDNWIQSNHNLACDIDGAWANSGQINQELLNSLLADSYFSRIPPKSTGKEYFNLEWLEKYLIKPLEPADIQATLTELTVKSIMLSIAKYSEPLAQILVCGGGIHNKYLLNRLKALAAGYTIHSTAEFGLTPNWVEAVAFAWFAKQTLSHKPANLPSVTGANKKTILGGIYLANKETG